MSQAGGVKISLKLVAFFRPLQVVEVDEVAGERPLFALPDRSSPIMACVRRVGPGDCQTALRLVTITLVSRAR